MGRLEENMNCDVTPTGTITMGNYTRLILRLPIVEDCQKKLIETLSTAQAVTFVLKKRQADANEDAAILLEWTVALPNARIELDTPSIGIIRVTLTSPETAALQSIAYYAAIQVSWSADEELEWQFGLIQIEHDTIR
jgi:hypothetical protein